MEKNQPPAMAGGEKSPKLEMAAKEIQDILDRYDIAGVVNLFTPGHYRHILKLNPSFSLCDLNKNNQLIVNQPIVDPNDEAAAKQKIANTVNMITNLRLYVTKIAQSLIMSEMQIRQTFGIKPPEKPGGPYLPIKNKN